MIVPEKDFIELYETMMFRFDSRGWRAIAAKVPGIRPSPRNVDDFQNLTEHINACPWARDQAAKALRIDEDRPISRKETAIVYLWVVGVLALNDAEFERFGGLEAASHIFSLEYLASRAGVDWDEFKRRIATVKTALSLWNRNP